MTSGKISIQEGVHLENVRDERNYTYTHIPICLPVADEAGRRNRRKKDNSQKATLFTTVVYVLIPKKYEDFSIPRWFVINYRIPR